MPKAAHPLPFSVDYLKSILHLDPETGIFRWLKDRSNGKIKKGSVAGGAHRSKSNGIWYLRLGINGKQYQGHRIAYFMYHTKDPYPLEIDHWDRNGLNNSKDNLREVTTAQNNMNKGIYHNNKSGYPGVYLLQTGQWEARLRDKRIGTTYKTESEAILARYTAETNDRC